MAARIGLAPIPHGLTGRRATLTLPGNGAAGRSSTCVVPLRRRMPDCSATAALEIGSLGRSSTSEGWSARQELHLRSPGSRPDMLLLHHALWRSRWDLHPHSSRRQRVAFLFSYGSKMVGSAGNAPVRLFQFYFMTSDLQSDNWIASRKNCLDMKSCDILCLVKIHVDKIEGGPPHVLNRRDVRLIIETVPGDWTKEIKEIRISNSLEWNSHTFFSRYDGSLTIYSRNRTKERVLNAVLSELAAISIGLDRGVRYRPKAVRDRLSKMTAAYKQKLLPLIGPPPQPKVRVALEPYPKRSEVHVSLEGFHEMRFPFVPNDPE